MSISLSGNESITERTLDGLVTVNADVVDVGTLVINGTTVDLADLFNKTTDTSDDILEGMANLFLTPAERADIAANTAARHAPVTLGTANGLALGGVGGQELSLVAASASSTGALTSADWSTFNGKQAAITGAASTITSANLTASLALVSDGAGKVSASSVTATELGYLAGATSNIQAQLNAVGSGPWQEVVTPGGSFIRTYTVPATVEVNNKLNVYGDIMLNGNLYTGNRVLGVGSTSGGGPFWIGLQGTGTDAQRVAIAIDGNSASTGLVSSIIFRTNDAHRMTIVSNGNVGIGATDPKAPLQIGSGDGDKIVFAESSGVAGGKIAHLSGWGLGFYAGRPSQSDSSFLTFQTSGASGYNQRMRINSDGSIAMGLDTPRHNLDVAGTVSARSGVTLRHNLERPTKGLSSGLVRRRFSHNGAYHPASEDEMTQFLYQLCALTETRTAPNISSLSPAGDNYGYEFSGFIWIATEGYYSFGTNADDASDMFVDGRNVANWYGGHAFNPSGTPGGNTSTMYLTKGYHRFLYRFEEGGGQDGCEALWIPTAQGGSSWTVIPASVFSYDINEAWAQPYRKVARLSGNFSNATSGPVVMLSGSISFPRPDLLPPTHEVWLRVHADFEWSLVGSGGDFVNTTIDISTNGSSWPTNNAYHQSRYYNAAGGGGRGPPLFPITAFRQLTGSSEIIYWRIVTWRTSTDDELIVYATAGGVEVTVECIRNN